MVSSEKAREDTWKTNNETEINNLPDIELKAFVKRMLTELGKTIDEQSENFNKETENIKNNQSELKNTIPKKKNTLEVIIADYVIHKNAQVV